MNNSVNMNVVHESEAQRQFARVKLPANIKYKDQDNYISNKVIDVSAGGFSMAVNSGNYKKNEVYKGVLSFVIDKVTIGLNVNFQVSTEDLKHGQVGCIFQNLGEREISSLRYIISSYLAGELVTAGSVINTLQRDNFTKDRKNKIDNTQSGFARFKAIIGSLFFLTSGALAFFFVANMLYSTLFVTRANNAVVAIKTVTITAPDSGSINVLSKENTEISRGKPLASISQNAYDLGTSNLENSLQLDDISKQINKNILINSPCNCYIGDIEILDGLYVNKDKPLIRLYPSDEKAYIKANFSYEYLTKIKVGDEVLITYPGSKEKQIGKVIKLELGNSEQTTTVKVNISTENKIEFSKVGTPVYVTVGSSLFEKLVSIF